MTSSKHKRSFKKLRQREVFFSKKAYSWQTEPNKLLQKHLLDTKNKKNLLDTKNKKTLFFLSAKQKHLQKVENRSKF